MTGNFRVEIPAARCWLRMASLLVPRNARAVWLHGHETSLQSLVILEERGELAGDGPWLLAWLCRHAAGNAFRVRWGGFDPAKWFRSPAFALGAGAAAVLLLAVCTNGFQVTRSLIDAFGGKIGRATSDRLFANFFPLVFALAAGALAAKGRLSLRGHSKMYLSFLALKTVLLAVVLFALWIEGGAAIRAHIPFEMVRVIIGGLLYGVAFIATFTWAVMWTLGDQQHRCPVCLRRLVLPVRMGSWASVFDPAATEWICEAGHGSLCMSEIGTGEAGRWVGGEAVPATVAGQDFVPTFKSL